MNNEFSNFVLINEVNYYEKNIVDDMTIQQDTYVCQDQPLSIGVLDFLHLDNCTDSQFPLPTAQINTK